MIPEAQLLNVLACQELIPRRIMFLLPGQTVFKAVQFHGQPSHGTIEVKKVSPERMLAPELKPRKAARSQRPPELGLFACLLPAQPPGNTGRIHGAEGRRTLQKDKPWPSTRVIHAKGVCKRASSPQPSPPKEERGEPLACCSAPPDACQIQRALAHPKTLPSPFPLLLGRSGPGRGGPLLG
jgi:hypothetical protein